VDRGLAGASGRSIGRPDGSDCTAGRIGHLLVELGAARRDGRLVVGDGLRDRLDRTVLGLDRARRIAVHHLVQLVGGGSRLGDRRLEVGLQCHDVLTPESEADRAHQT